MKQSAKRKRFSIMGRALAPAIALASLLGIAAYAVSGPTGVLAWHDYRTALQQREAELAKLDAERAALKNRVELLDGDAVDADYAGELLRRELNVVHPNEIILPLKEGD